MLKDKDFQWRPYHQEAYDKMIGKLNEVDTQLLVNRSENKKIVLVVLDNSIEALLTTEDDKLICRASKLLSSCESNYSFVERQLLALVMALNKFRLMLQPARFRIKAPNKDIERIVNQVHRPERVDNLLLKIPCGFDEFEVEVDPTLPSTSAKQRAFHVPEEIFYIDGACRGNGKPNCRASWAVCAENDCNLELTGYVEESPSNQSAELQAAIEACQIAKSRGLKTITIVTDSKYLYSAATLWIDKWKSNNWTDHKKKPVINTKQFEKLLTVKIGLDIEWCHVKGHSDNIGNNRADALARSLLDPKTATLCAMVNNEVDIQNEDPEISSLVHEIKDGKHPDLEVIQERVYFVDNKLPEGLQHRLYVPKRSRLYILQLAHDDATYGGHLGIRKTFKKLSRFYWPRMHLEIESYVKSCSTCQKFKSPTGLPAGYLHSIPVSGVFEHIHLDIVGPLTTTYEGNRYVITATDAMSKWAFAKPSQTVRTRELIQFVEEEILAVHGMPKRIITDRGTQFTSGEWREFISKLKVEHKLTTPYHPQANGIDERLNGTLMRILRNYVDAHQEKWDEHLKWALYLYNTTVHDSTGYSPYHVLYGMDSRSPLKPEQPNASIVTESLTQVRSRIRNDIVSQNKASQDQQKLYYDRNRAANKLTVGQLVYMRIHVPPTHLSKKFFYKWDGPVVITRFVGDETNPRAVIIFDYDNMKRKVLALNDVKPIIDTYERTSTSEHQESEGHHLIDISSDSQATKPFYDTVDDTVGTEAWDPIQKHTSDTNQSDHSEGGDTMNSPIAQPTLEPQVEVDLDIPSRTLHGPTYSSPRRVTISDTVDTRFYIPTDTLEMSVTLNESPNQPGTVETASTVDVGPNAARDSTPTNLDTTMAETQERETQDYQVDNVHRDPNYIPHPNQETQSVDPRRVSTDSNSSDTSQSRIPRYQLRTRNKDWDPINWWKK